MLSRINTKGAEQDGCFAPFASLRDPLFQCLQAKILVAERRSFRDFYDVEFKVRGLVTAVAGVGQQHKTVLKQDRVFLLNRIVDAVDGRIDHPDHLRFFSLGLILLNGRHGFHDFMHLKVGEFPVLVLAGKPELGMVGLNACHKFSETWFVSIGQFHFQAVNTVLQNPLRAGGLVAGHEKNGQQDKSYTSHATNLVGCSGFR